MTFTEFLGSGIPFFTSSIPNFILGISLCVIIPYLIGSVNFSVIISRRYGGDDVRNHGSGNAGTTNMFRTYGRKAAMLTFTGDFVKSLVAVAFGFALMPGDEYAYVAAFFCILGHAYPLFFGFKGGKGVAVAAGAILILNPVVFLILAVCFTLFLLGTKYVSLSSMLCALAFPLINYKLCVWFAPYPVKMIFSVLMAVLVIFLHRKNISRLASGTESKFVFKKNENMEKNL